MSKIEDLIQKLCPNGVERKTFEEVFEIRNGYTPSKTKKEFWTNGNIPWFRMEDIRLNGNILSDSIQHITKEAVKGGRLFPSNSFILATTATIGEHALLIVDSLANQRFTNLKVRKSLIDKLLIKFLHYYMFLVDEWCKKNVNVSGFASVDMAKLKKLEIAIPPIEVQQEIVRLLDEYTKSKDILLEKLKRELELRKKQYEYYSENLLSFEGKDVEWVPIEDVTYYPNKRVPINEIDLYVGVENLLKDKKGACKTEITTSSNSAIEFLEGDILVGNIRPYLKKIWHSDCRGGTNGDVVLIRIKESYTNLYNRFLYFLISSDRFFDYANQNSKGGKMPRGDKSKILQYKIPIPSLAEQERIVSILEQYEEVSGKLIEKLNQEIIQVQKQYEYYREKLLTF